MKQNLKTLLWSLVGGFSLVGMLVFAENVTIEVNPANAVQYINSVRVKQVNHGGENVDITSVGPGLSQINTKIYNVLLGTTGNQINGGSKSAILGGTGNTINGNVNTIIAGELNTIMSSGRPGNTILGGKSNEITGNSDYSVIAGGWDNKIEGATSVILGGKSNETLGNGSAIVGSENSVMGNNSVAMGNKSKVYGNNSFLWKDSDEDATLTGNNIFAVVSRKGMVINSRPNDYAQLTIGGPLVVSINSTNDQNVSCGLGQGGGTIKTILTGGHYCLCNCDGSGRNSMFGKGQCQSVCNGESIQPICGTNLYRNIISGVYAFSGTCEFGEVVEGTGAYFVDKNNIVHWVCQTIDGKSVSCNSENIDVVDV